MHPGSFQSPGRAIRKRRLDTGRTQAPRDPIDGSLDGSPVLGLEDELVPAEAVADDAFFADGGRDRPQQLVPGRPPEVVVHPLQALDVEHGLDGAPTALLPGAPVPEPRQLVGEQRAHLFAFRHLLHALAARSVRGAAALHFFAEHGRQSVLTADAATCTVWPSTSRSPGLGIRSSSPPKPLTTSTSWPKSRPPPRRRRAGNRSSPPPRR